MRLLLPGLAALLWAWLELRARIWQPATASARLAELQSRIRPHFLFNTLNTAVALVRVDPSRAEAVLEDLSELFRVALAETGAAVSLAEDLPVVSIDREQFKRVVVNLVDNAAEATQGSGERRIEVTRPACASGGGRPARCRDGCRRWSRARRSRCRHGCGRHAGSAT